MTSIINYLKPCFNRISSVFSSKPSDVQRKKTNTAGESQATSSISSAASTTTTLSLFARFRNWISSFFAKLKPKTEIEKIAELRDIRQNASLIPNNEWSELFGRTEEESKQKSLEVPKAVAQYKDLYDSLKWKTKKELHDLAVQYLIFLPKRKMGKKTQIVKDFLGYISNQNNKAYIDEQSAKHAINLNKQAKELMEDLEANGAGIVLEAYLQKQV